MAKRYNNQKQIIVNKSATDQNNLYTKNNLSAIDIAAKELQSTGGFKLYMYIAKNQNNYKFYLSSKDFMAWSGLKATAYNTAVAELIEKKFLKAVKTNRTLDGKELDDYIFYDKPHIDENTITQTDNGFNY